MQTLQSLASPNLSFPISKSTANGGGGGGGEILPPNKTCFLSTTGCFVASQRRERFMWNSRVPSVWSPISTRAASVEAGTSRLSIDIAEKDVLTALSQIIDPDFGTDIVSCGFVKDLHIDEPLGEVSFRLELTTPACPIKDMFEQKANEVVSLLPWVKKVNVKMSAQPARPIFADQLPKGLQTISNIVAVSSCKDLPVASAVSKLIIPGLVDQFATSKKAFLPCLLSEHPQLCPYHCFPPGMSHPITTFYELSYGEMEMKQGNFSFGKGNKVSCKIIDVRSGVELPEKCRELALHFQHKETLL